MKRMLFSWGEGLHRLEGAKSFSGTCSLKFAIKLGQVPSFDPSGKILHLTTHAPQLHDKPASIMAANGRS